MRARKAVNKARQAVPDAACRRSGRMRKRRREETLGQSPALHWISLENALRGALQRNELILYYQLQACMSDGSLCGVETLLRWRHPGLGMVIPADFIPIAEDIGLILPIGEWVIRQACIQARTWQDLGLAPITMAVNVSGHQIAAGGLVQTVEQALVQTGLSARYHRRGRRNRRPAEAKEPGEPAVAVCLVQPGRILPLPRRGKLPAALAAAEASAPPP